MERNKAPKIAPDFGSTTRHIRRCISGYVPVEVRDVALNNAPILLVFWPVFGVALRGTDNEYAPRNAP